MPVGDDQENAPPLRQDIRRAGAVDNIPRVIFNEEREAQQLQIAPQRPPIFHAFVEGIPLRFIDNVFAADKMDFVRFCARNPHLADSIVILTYFPQPVNEVLFQIRL